MKTLRANVNRITGKTKHWVGTPEGPVPCEKAAFVEIVQDDGAYYLFRSNAEGVRFADTWHLTLEEAKLQAKSEYEIAESDWEEVMPSVDLH